MGVRYLFDLIGRSGSTMQGSIDGAPYTVATALLWALDDLRTGRARPARIIADGEIAYDLAALEQLAGLLDRLEQLGGQWTGQRSAWASLEILTPLGDTEKLIWMTPSALASQLDAWEAAGVSGPRLAVVMREADL
jgi:hypothetical protein